jgi:hypothetical protein
VLPPATEHVWSFLKDQPVLGGFVLIGGSAMALRIGHRLSEDLDFAWVEPRLPRVRLDALRRAAEAGGFDFERQEHEAAVVEFAEAGLDILDYQQNYLVNHGVRVSFFAPERPLASVLTGAPEPKVRVATLAELFKAKSLVSAQRSKTRDWLDLYLLLKEHGFTLQDYRAAFVEADVASQCDTGLSRLCSGVPQSDDEGYAHLLPHPPTLVEMRAFFTARRDEFEIELASKALEERRQARVPEP